MQEDIQKGVWTRDEDERLQHALQQLGFKYVMALLLVLDFADCVDGLAWLPWCGVVMRTVSYTESI